MKTKIIEKSEVNLIKHQLEINSNLDNQLLVKPTRDED